VAKWVFGSVLVFSLLLLRVRSRVKDLLAVHFFLLVLFLSIFFFHNLLHSRALHNMRGQYSFILSLKLGHETGYSGRRTRV
jgi:nitrate reductase gamma subunit